VTNQPTKDRAALLVATTSDVRHQPNRLLRLSELPPYVGLKRTQIHKLIECGEFPKPIVLSDSGRAVAWIESEVCDWQASRIAARNAK
jgi:prophage regulatory protein